MAINQITTANTFQQWLVATQSLIAVANNLTDGSGGIFYANTDVTIDGDLIVTGNITLDAVGYNDLSIAGNLSVGAFANIETANVTTLVGSANTAIYANITNAITTTSADSLAFAIALG